MFSFSFISRYFSIFSLISSVIHWLFSSILFSLHMFVFFAVFFQAEDGIRDRDVTGVQTCALPILLEIISIIVSDHNAMRPDIN